jgi:hypothetical protein
LSGYEEGLVARAEVLEDTGDLVQTITGVLAGAQAAGVDPAAVAGLAGAVRALDPGADTNGYDPGGQDDRRAGGGYRSDGEFLEAASDAEGDVVERVRDVGKLGDELAVAMDDAQAALEAAYAMAVRDPCGGCHGDKEAAIADAERRISLCETAAGVVDPLAGRLREALGRLRQVPQDLGEAYELVYEFIRRGGKLPRLGRWIEGAGSRVLLVMPGASAGNFERLSPRQAHRVRACVVVVVNDFARVRAGQCRLVALLAAARVPGSRGDVLADDVHAVLADLGGLALCVGSRGHGYCGAWLMLDFGDGDRRRRGRITGPAAASGDRSDDAEQDEQPDGGA